MLYRKLFFALVTFSVFGFIANVSAGYSSDGVLPMDQASFPLLRIDMDARSIALSSAFAAVEEGASLANPATLSFQTGRKLAIAYRQHIADIRGGAFYFGSPLTTIERLPLFFGGTLSYLSYGVFDNFADEFGNPVEGSFSPYSTVVSLSLSALISKGLSLGVTTKAVYEKLSDPISMDIEGYASSGLGVDVGFYYRKSSKSSLGITIANIGQARVDDADGDDLSMPLTLTAGAALRPRSLTGPLLLCDITKPLDEYLGVNVGLEIPMFHSAAFLRAGYGFTSNDVRNLVGKINSDEKSNNYDDQLTQSDWTLLTLGGGIRAIGKSHSLHLDVATEIRTSGVPASLILTTSFEF